MISDDELIREIVAILDSDNPPEGVELREGYGVDYWIESIKPVINAYGERELDIAMMTRNGKDIRAGRVAVSFRRDQVDADDLEESEAELLATEAAFQISQLVFEMIDGTPQIDRDEVIAAIGTPDELYAEVLADLRTQGDVEVVLPGIVRLTLRAEPGEVHLSAGRSIEIHVTPPQFHELVLEGEISHRQGTPFDQKEMPGGLGMALLYLDETIGPMQDDERFVVFHEGTFRASIRSELPPIRGTDSSPPQAEGIDGTWWASRPDGNPE